VRPLARVVKRQTAELCPALEKISELHSARLRTLSVARTVQLRNFSEKIPSRASIS
jgi:hypothetical protein